jgi:hypothetical protein
MASVSSQSRLIGLSFLAISIMSVPAAFSLVAAGRSDALLLEAAAAGVETLSAKAETLRSESGGQQVGHDAVIQELAQLKSELGKVREASELRAKESQEVAGEGDALVRLNRDLRSSVEALRDS